MQTSTAVAGALAQLRALLGARASDADAVREHHSHGESYHAPAAPDIVCFPASTDEVSEIARISQRFQLPVVPFGAGTSLEGHVHALRGGISIDLREMNHVLRVSDADLDATVEAGVTRLQLARALRNTGLMFPIDPGADATLGGMAATRASGTTAVRYGTMRENVLGLTVVLADGKIIRTGTRARKSAAGYDLTRLFVGSEGTLGIITEVTLRLHPVPEAVSAAVCSFHTMQGAVDTVIATIQLGVPVARIELLDETQMDAINRYSKWSTRSRQRCCSSSTATARITSRGRPRPSRRWRWNAAAAGSNGRRDSRIASGSGRRGTTRTTPAWRCVQAAAHGPTDVCVPISRLADCVVETERETRHASFPVCLVGHAGDGNFHLMYLLNPDDPAEVAEARRLNEQLVARALAMGGTCTGEHGVGSGKVKYMRAEHGDAVDVMQAIKRALDPDNRMNPGKVLPLDDTESAVL